MWDVMFSQNPDCTDNPRARANRGKGHVGVHVSEGQNGGMLLKPWQAYAHYMLTGGGDVIWFGCRKEFKLEHVTQEPAGGGILSEDDDAGAAPATCTDQTPSPTPAKENRPLNEPRCGM